MLLYGHWIVPMYAGIPRTAKPPGMNWIIAGIMKITGSESGLSSVFPLLWPESPQR
jgi:4-amino-4-deoxy-L-arabinose transferase-like glycosyltransferase